MFAFWRLNMLPGPAGRQAGSQGARSAGREASQIRVRVSRGDAGVPRRPPASVSVQTPLSSSALNRRRVATRDPGFNPLAQASSGQGLSTLDEFA